MRSDSPFRVHRGTLLVSCSADAERMKNTWHGRAKKARNAEDGKDDLECLDKNAWHGQRQKATNAWDGTVIAKVI